MPVDPIMLRSVKDERGRVQYHVPSGTFTNGGHPNYGSRPSEVTAFQGWSALSDASHARLRGHSGLAGSMKSTTGGW
jgi:hypothetical protein